MFQPETFRWCIFASICAQDLELTFQIEIHIINTKAEFAYPCDDPELVKKYGGPDAKCYTDDGPKVCGSSFTESCKNHLYISKQIHVTVIDDDHSADATSNKKSWSNSQTENFQKGISLNILYSEHFKPGKIFHLFDPNFQSFLNSIKVWNEV